MDNSRDTASTIPQGDTSRTGQSRTGQSDPNAQEAARDVAKDAQARAKEVGRTVTEQTKEAAQELRQSAEASFSDSKGQLAEQIAGLARAFRSGSDALRDEELGDFARLSDGAAERLEDLSDQLNRDTDDLLSDLQNVAQERPVLFMGGLLTIGVLSARFLRSSQGSSDYDDYDTDYDTDFSYQGYERGDE